MFATKEPFTKGSFACLPYFALPALALLAIGINLVTRSKNGSQFTPKAIAFEMLTR